MEAVAEIPVIVKPKEEKGALKRLKKFFSRLT